MNVRLTLSRSRSVSGFVLALTCATSAGAVDVVPGMLFRGGTVVPPPTIEVDAALPTGPRAGWEPRPLVLPPAGARGDANVSRQCSAAFPVCVHGGTAASRAIALELVTRAFRSWRYVQDMPAPLGDGGLGGGPELDVYLSSDVGGEQRSGVRVFEDPPMLRSDRASAWCQLDVTRLTERAAALCVAEASAVAVDAASGPGMRRGWASYQVGAVATPDAVMLRALDDAQREPFQPLLTRESSSRSEAAFAFWAFVDEAWATGGRRRLPLAMLHLSSAASVRSTSHPEWNNAPDELDVLRHALGGDGQRIAEFWGEWAIARAFFGSRASGTHAPELRGSGGAGRVGFDWVLDYSSLPRHLAGPNPIQPLSAAYIWLELDAVPLHANLAFRAEWEAPVVFKWVVLALDAQGRERGRWALPYLERATSAETTIVNFEGAAGLLLIGTNLGGVDVSHPFDPDQEPWEPHGYSVYVTELAP